MRFLPPLGAFLCLTLSAAARTLHVDAARGADTNDGRSPDSAWATLQHAAN